MISTGVFSPLTGFMVQEDYDSVVETMHLANGLVWSLPITLSVSDEEAGTIGEGDEIALTDGTGRVLATMTVEDRYSYDKEREAREVFGTTSDEHPGVAAVYRQEDVLLGGEITLLVDDPNPKPFPEYHYTPHELREVFAEKGWKRVVGFQTRNPVHRSHEYIQKSALEIVDGLLLNPLVGETRSEDIPADVRMRSYETILEKYYPKDRTLLAVFPAAMRYGGPREAIFHAVCRKNYGCTHFIVGRDHAGPGKDSSGTPFYGDYDAQHIFDEFEEGEIGLTPLILRARLLLPRVPGDGNHQDLPPRQGEPRLYQRDEGARDALQGRVPAAGVLPPRGHRGAHRRAAQQVGRSSRNRYTGNLEQLDVKER